MERSCVTLGYIMELRKWVGKRPLIMAAAGVAVMDGEEKILLQRRIDNNLWGLPGGALELGETLEEAAKRELLEETGLTARSLELFNVFSGEELHYTYPNGDEVYIVSAVYLCRDFTGNLVNDDEETKDLRFFRKDEIDFKWVNPPDRPILAAVLQPPAEN